MAVHHANEIGHRIQSPRSKTVANLIGSIIKYRRKIGPRVLGKTAHVTAIARIPHSPTDYTTHPGRRRGGDISKINTEHIARHTHNLCSA